MECDIRMHATCFWKDIESDVYAHTLTCTHTRTYIHSHTHTHTPALYTTYAHVCGCTHKHRYVHQWCIRMHTTSTHWHTCTYHDVGVHITHTHRHTHTHTHSLQVREFWKILHLFAYRLHSGKCTAKEREQGLTNSQVAQLCRCREMVLNSLPCYFQRSPLDRISFVHTDTIIKKGGNSFLLNLASSVFYGSKTRYTQLCSLCPLYFLSVTDSFLFVSWKHRYMY